ncbi:MAG TPA: FecR domain-containing protein, partial [Planctomycetota bacterium]|nr:FecR domain-containing protein [Planctomycetota bacterium]
MLTLLAALLIGVPADGSESPRGVAKLAILQGMLEGKAGENGEYKAFKAGDEIEAGTMLRTASGTKASVDFSDGSELRIAESTEVSVDDPRKVGLQHGHIYVKIVRGSKRFEIAFLQLGVSADAAVVDVEYTPRVKDGPPAATMIRVIDGMARATSPKFGANVFS